jgi:hypothetical protein
MKKLSGVICEHLFADPEANVYAVLDGASVPKLLEHLSPHAGEYECLYRGELKPDLAAAAPYLVSLKEDSELTQWIVGEGWGKHWGVFVICQAPLPVMRRHFRTFLVVHTSEGKPLYFRYYDPRVLRIHLPTCNADELSAMFGPVRAYVMESEKPGALMQFRVKEGVLKSETKPLLVG